MAVEIEDIVWRHYETIERFNQIQELQAAVPGAIKVTFQPRGFDSTTVHGVSVAYGCLFDALRGDMFFQERKVGRLEIEVREAKKGLKLIAAELKKLEV